MYDNDIVMAEGAQCHCTCVPLISEVMGHLSPDFASVHYSTSGLWYATKSIQLFGAIYAVMLPRAWYVGKLQMKGQSPEQLDDADRSRAYDYAVNCEWANCHSQLGLCALYLAIHSTLDNTMEDEEEWEILI